MTWGLGVEHVLSMHKALDLNPSTGGNKRPMPCHLEDPFSEGLILWGVTMEQPPTPFLLSPFWEW